ncbi:DNA-binding transcription factor, amino acid sensing, Cha4 [Schizosaccharomyces pombe]|uniref:Uncharacterized transcriptional regulatory protein C1683.13c n=1 Tax=Schizosaccharomyces pombe (strain 972 / ATCC 24843) TaxID=284812 RepID=YHDD_SCHPO|nr:putative transcription factor Cha4 [Schizosaccharomyces pombe]Q9P6I9.1 RecName: Full=Uncharacterized transcriptional regulatory protein C1683.13c [Schizosaccharomyces pombe 972h-]CAB91175.1 transcription factor Cha4 (predicted) [Schizosaccharomyces pombe]|eukprot:NP_595069.1 putative transcription factor Cha4 [Schizosaccharomyces pombe]
MQMKPRQDKKNQEIFRISCQRCRQRKIKCDRLHPCFQCVKSNSQCFYPEDPIRRRAPKEYVEALERQIAFFEAFVKKLAKVGSDEQSLMIQDMNNKIVNEGNEYDQTPDISARKRRKHFRMLPQNNFRYFQFYGTTNVISASNLTTTSEIPTFKFPIFSKRKYNDTENLYEQPFHLEFDTCQELLSLFFLKQYHNFMFVFRDYFIRDFELGGGPYYSQWLLFAICSIGAMISPDDDLKNLSNTLANIAEKWVLDEGLNSPDITTLQTLLVLGIREIGRGLTFKGWLFSGMAFRLVYDMGLHLDPDHWDHSEESRIDREVRRRCFWGCFTLDKLISLCYGRPPGLYLKQTDVRNTTQLPYISELDEPFEIFNKKSELFAAVSAGEDRRGLVQFWLNQVELCKIIHRMLTEVFEDRTSSVLEASINNIHTELQKWIADIPMELQWNTRSQKETSSTVLLLHMLYHSVIIILNRPSDDNYLKLDNTERYTFEICWKSAKTIVQLLKIYFKKYDADCLPMTFIHIATSAARIILVKLNENIPEDGDVCNIYLEIITNALDVCANVWPLASQASRAILNAYKSCATSPKENNEDSLPLQRSPSLDDVSRFDSLDYIFSPNVKY